MRGPLNPLRLAQWSGGICGACRRGLASHSKVFQEGDIVLLHKREESSRDGLLSSPLHPSKIVHTHRGPISHTELIGTRPRDIVKTTKGNEYYVQEPTLAEYITNTPRKVTPIYPGDAELIVSLLDIHVSQPSDASKVPPKYEVLEAGTGHGSLTLYLARAIHPANSPSPALPATPQVEGEEDASDDPVYQGSSAEELYESMLESWKQSRNAVLHSVERSSKYSTHARKNVSRFRQGMYFGHVDFHVADVSEWIREQQKTRDEPQFLTRAFLDLPGSETHLEAMASALKVDGMLAVFNPSVTQIVECVQECKKKNLPLWLDQVVELGVSSQARQWDIRAVKPRALVNAADPVSDPAEGTEMDSLSTGAPSQIKIEDGKEPLEKSEWKMVCRPRVGERTVGGGFLGVWRRKDTP